MLCSGGFHDQVCLELLLSAFYPSRIDENGVKFATFGAQLLTAWLKSSGKVKTGQLWSKNKEELTKQLAELKTELNQLRIQKIVSSGTKLTKMYVESKPIFSPRSFSWKRDG